MESNIPSSSPGACRRKSPTDSRAQPTVSRVGSRSDCNFNFSSLSLSFRAIPSFGRAVVRAFPSNICTLVQPTAHQYEDILQCAIPAFDGLLPSPHNEVVIDLLYSMALWHGLAKLRQHSDETVLLLKHATKIMGGQIRRFKRETCALYDTRTTDGRVGGGPKTKRKGKGKQSTGKSKKKELNLETAKNHLVAHTVFDVPVFGTTDSYSTQPVSICGTYCPTIYFQLIFVCVQAENSHRGAKNYYGMTNKNNAVSQIALLERRSESYNTMFEKDPFSSKGQGTGTVETQNMKAPERQAEYRQSEDRPPLTNPTEHHHIPKATRAKHHIVKFTHDNKSDPAFHVSTNCLSIYQYYAHQWN